MWTISDSSRKSWEKLPSSIRNKFPKSVISSLASFPDDWPEIEYLAIPAYLGNNFNHFLDDPRDRANYGSIAAAIVSPLSRGNRRHNLKHH
jgi:choline dehydrogenase